jgi:hypothetical protein
MFKMSGLPRNSVVWLDWKTAFAATESKIAFGNLEMQFVYEGSDCVGKIDAD